MDWTPKLIDRLYDYFYNTHFTLLEISRRLSEEFNTRISRAQVTRKTSELKWRRPSQTVFNSKRIQPPDCSSNLLMVSSNKCCYPYGDGPYIFCLKATQPGFQYCDDHYKLCIDIKSIERLDQYYAKELKFIDTLNRNKG